MHPIKPFNSLKARLIVSSLLMTLIVVPLIGFTLTQAFEERLVSAIKNELSAFSYSILAVAEVENGELKMPDSLLENQFNVSQSGLYAMITQLSQQPKQEQKHDALWRSPSLLAMAEISASEIPVSKLPMLGKSQFSTVDFAQQPHFVLSLSVSFSTLEQDFPVVVHIIKSRENFNQLVEQFTDQLWLWLLVLMALLFAVQGIWLIWTLKPLTALTTELSLVEQGKLAKIEKHYPLELAKLTKQLNLLLETEKKQRQRYRNALSDLAHSLKTPLAIVQTQSDLTQVSLEQIVAMNQMIEHQLKRAQTAGQSSWYLGINIEPVLNKLVSSIEKLYASKGLSIKVVGDTKVTFQGDETDFLEVFGNLLDNACKAAKNNVVLCVTSSSKELTITVEDDGVGIEEALLERILERGTRADTYAQGHGIGLAIVKDIVTSYGGTIAIERSKTLGGAKFIIRFSRK